MGDRGNRRRGGIPITLRGRMFTKHTQDPGFPLQGLTHTKSHAKYRILDISSRNKRNVEKETKYRGGNEKKVRTMYNTVSVCSSTLLCSCNKTLTKNSLEWKGLLGLQANPSWRSARAGTQGRNLETRTEAKPTKEPCFLT